jgi:putative holliday junction resolvase
LTRLLGVDLGRRRIGIAVADEASGVVRPLTTLRRGSLERDVASLRRLAGDQGIDELVIGLPRNMDGSEGTQAVETRRWADAVGAALDLPVCLRDERLTSEAAEARLGSPRRGRSGGPPSSSARSAYRAAVDREAAVAIVQAELDARAALQTRAD